MIVKEIRGGPERAFCLVFETGDEVVDHLTSFAEERGLATSHFTAIGAFRKAVLAWFDIDRGEYLEIPVEEQVEVVSMVGNVARAPGGRKVHAHVAVGKRDGEALAGHLVSGIVRPTLELFLTETGADLRRVEDEATSLALIR